MATEEKLIVTQRKPLGRQVCVPADWTDEQVTEVINSIDLCGTELGWVINKDLGRVRCEADAERVHIVLDA